MTAPCRRAKEVAPARGFFINNEWRPVAGGRGAYVSFPVPDRPEIAELITAAADEASRRWASHT